MPPGGEADSAIIVHLFVTTYWNFIDRLCLCCFENSVELRTSEKKCFCFRNNQWKSAKGGTRDCAIPVSRYSPSLVGHHGNFGFMG